MWEGIGPRIRSGGDTANHRARSQGLKAKKSRKDKTPTADKSWHGLPDDWIESAWTEAHAKALKLNKRNMWFYNGEMCVYSTRGGVTCERV
eukprot:808809-Rhodomonas_salina.2